MFGVQLFAVVSLVRGTRDCVSAEKKKIDGNQCFVGLPYARGGKNGGAGGGALTCSLQRQLVQSAVEDTHTLRAGLQCLR